MDIVCGGGWAFKYVNSDPEPEFVATIMILIPLLILLLYLILFTATVMILIPLLILLLILILYARQRS